MKFLNKDNALAKPNVRITQLEDKLSQALSKIDGLIFSNRELKSKVEKLTKENQEFKIVNKQLLDENAPLPTLNF